MLSLCIKIRLMFTYQCHQTNAVWLVKDSVHHFKNVDTSNSSSSLKNGTLLKVITYVEHVLRDIKAIADSKRSAE